MPLLERRPISFLVNLMPLRAMTPTTFHTSSNIIISPVSELRSQRCLLKRTELNGENRIPHVDLIPEMQSLIHKFRQLLLVDECPIDASDVMN